jgi:hypothetical protein
MITMGLVTTVMTVETTILALTIPGMMITNMVLEWEALAEVVTNTHHRTMILMALAIRGMKMIHTDQATGALGIAPPASKTINFI